MQQVPTSWPLRLSFLLLIACPLAFGAAPDAPTATLRTRVAEVRLTFSVSDENRHAVATLSEKDFAVVDHDFVVRDFQSFRRSERTELQMAVLADLSESVTPDVQHEMAAIVNLLSYTARVPEENLSLVAVQGVEPAVVCEGNCRTSHAAEQLCRAKSGGLTPLFDAIVFAGRLLDRRAGDRARKVLIVFSDGDDTISRHSAAEALSEVLDRDVQIYTIDLNRTRNTGRGAVLLEEIASFTGGRAFKLQDGVEPVVDAVLEDFHADYIVTYKLPSHAAGFHAIRILPTHNQNLEFHCRRGYYYEKPAVQENIP